MQVARPGNGEWRTGEERVGTCPEAGDNPGKPGLIPHTGRGPKPRGAFGVACVRLACWRGNGPPRRRSVAGLRGRSATLGLRHGPDSYGRQQWGILRNGRKPDAATRKRGERTGLDTLIVHAVNDGC